jgi:hypothetical protein
MAIHDAVAAIEALLHTYDGGGAKPVKFQVRPSGDDVDVIKIAVEIGDAKVDQRTWVATCEAAIRKRVPEAAGFRLQFHAEE